MPNRLPANAAIVHSVRTCRRASPVAAAVCGADRRSAMGNDRSAPRGTVLVAGATGGACAFPSLQSTSLHLWHIHCCGQVQGVPRRHGRAADLGVRALAVARVPTPGSPAARSSPRSSRPSARRPSRPGRAPRAPASPPGRTSRGRASRARRPWQAESNPAESSGGRGSGRPSNSDTLTFDFFARAMADHTPNNRDHQPTRISARGRNGLAPSKRVEDTGPQEAQLAAIVPRRSAWPPCGGRRRGRSRAPPAARRSGDPGLQALAPPVGWLPDSSYDAACGGTMLPAGSMGGRDGRNPLMRVLPSSPPLRHDPGYPARISGGRQGNAGEPALDVARGLRPGAHRPRGTAPRRDRRARVRRRARRAELPSGCASTSSRDSRSTMTA
jgi:hypothetical protein